MSAGANASHSSTTVDAGMTAMHFTVYEGHVDTNHVLLGEASLKTAVDVNGCRPVCVIGQGMWGENTLKEAMRRLLLARRPAFRTRS